MNVHRRLIPEGAPPRITEHDHVACAGSGRWKTMRRGSAPSQRPGGSCFLLSCCHSRPSRSHTTVGDALEGKLEEAMRHLAAVRLVPNFLREARSTDLRRRDAQTRAWSWEWRHARHPCSPLPGIA